MAKKLRQEEFGKNQWPRWDIVHMAKTQMLSTYFFAKIKITGIRKERLCQINSDDALKEGGYTVEEFIEVWKRINGKWNPDSEVYVIDFELAYSDFKPGDIVTLSKECLEYQVHGDVEFEVTGYPMWWPGNEMVAIESEVKSYGAFATEFLEKVEV